eukprot:TRINITY_DN72768_c0_g1_i1.p1 TRINITY_DN72768_c0_g1~~TRINITY_DN72768_c0_g1_i1.p1  ORF type:complete len:204 (-),score=37.51 TRINITY_DN72768_c0_g1_i1:90-701(-)
MPVFNPLGSSAANAKLVEQIEKEVQLRWKSKQQRGHGGGPRTAYTRTELSMMGSIGYAAGSDPMKNAPPPVMPTRFSAASTLPRIEGNPRLAMKLMTCEATKNAYMSAPHLLPGAIATASAIDLRSAGSPSSRHSRRSSGGRSEALRSGGARSTSQLPRSTAGDSIGIRSEDVSVADYTSPPPSAPGWMREAPPESRALGHSR